MESIQPYRCKICNTLITKDNIIESHILTRKVSIRPLTKATGQQILGFNFKTQFSPCHEITDNTILCDTCDKALSKYEQERVELIKLKETDVSFSHGYAILKALDGNKIKLAYMADILRSSFTNKPIFAKVQLGPFEKQFKKCLYDTKSDFDNVFPTIVGKIHFDSGFKAAIIPQRVRINHVTYYRSITPGGWVWLIKVDSRSDELFEKYSIDQNHEGALIIDFRTKHFEKKILHEIYEIIK